METKPLPVRIGIIANPLSARDVRRVMTHAAGLTLGERANMLMRMLAALAACRIAEVWLMPEREGLRGLLEKQLISLATQLVHPLPQLRWLDMAVKGTAEDTHTAAALMQQHGIAAILVLGGDGTHRAVVKHCRQVPIAAVSTGTNNAFPPLREVTVTALATGMFAAGLVPRAIALQPRKFLQVTRQDASGALLQSDLALVDVGIFNEQILGMKAIGAIGTLRSLIVTQALPESVGLSAIAAMCQPLGTEEPAGLVVELRPETGPSVDTGVVPRMLAAALAPGLIVPCPVLSHTRLTRARPYVVEKQSGLVALDGEREISFQAGERLAVTLRQDAFLSIDVPACMQHISKHQLSSHLC